MVLIKLIYHGIANIISGDKNMSDELTRGVICFNKGTKMIPKMIVFLKSLRKHYAGNLTVFLEGEHDESLVSSIRDTFSANVVYRPISPSQHKALLRKIELCLDSPYDLSVVLDTDTVVVGEFSELFEAAKGHDLAIPHFAGWSSNGNTISKRIRDFAPLKPEYIEAAINYGPAINCGVFAWQRGSPIFKEWLEIASWGERQNIYIADEKTAQLLLPRYNIKIVDMKYNVSVLHDPGTIDPRVIHFHGKKSCIETKTCIFFLREFLETCLEDTCGIRKYAIDGCGDKRLKRFIHGNEPTMHAELKQEIRKVLGLAPITPVCKGFANEEITIVTACDKKYIEYLKLTLPNWVKHKHVDRFKMIVYVNGFRRVRRNSDLDFLRAYPNIKIIAWDMPEIESQREKMLSAFVLGTAKDVDTPFWVKMDADAFAMDDEPLLIPEMRDYVICGHKWGYSFAKHIDPLIKWANAQPAFKDTPVDVFDQTLVDGRRYCHHRVASFVQFHKSDFVRMAAAIAGTRLPVPSHDTYLWYVANRLGLPILRHNFKRHRGMSNKSDFEALKVIVAGIDGPKVPVVNVVDREDDNDNDSQD